MLVHDLFESGRLRNPEQTYLRFEDQEVSYGEMDRRVRRMGNALRELGLGRGDRLAIVMENRPAFLEVFLACSLTGIVLAPCNPEYTARELAHNFSRSGPSSVLTTETHLDDVVGASAEAGVDTLVTLEGAGETVALASVVDDQPTEVDEPDLDGSDPIVHMYTSGTTGKPKACEMSHQSWSHTANDFAKRGGFLPSDNLATCLPMHHSNALALSALGATAVGATFTLFARFSTSDWWDWMREHEVTSFNGLGGMNEMLLNAPERDDDAENPVEKVFATKVPVGFGSRFGLTAIPIYSQTEDPLLHINSRHRLDPADRRDESIGIPPGEMQAKIVDENGDELPRGETGEIVKRSPTSVMNGYFGQPEQTAEVLRDGWLYTGDLGFVDDDGWFYFVDRKKHVIRRSGENISSEDLEAVAREMTAVEEVAAIPVPDEIRGEEVKLLIAPREEAELEPESVIEHFRGRVADFKLPRYIEFVESYPRTPTERIRKVELKERERTESPDHWDRTEELDS